MNTGAERSPWGLCCGGTGGQTDTAVSAPLPQPPGSPHTQKGLTWVFLDALGPQVWKGFYPQTLGHLTSTQGEMHTDLHSSGDRHLAASAPVQSSPGQPPPEKPPS